MRKMTKILGLVILIVFMFSIAMAGEWSNWLIDISTTLAFSIEGQRLVVMNILTDMKQIDDVSVYRNNGYTIEKDYYYLDDHILEVLICPHESYPFTEYGIYHIARVMKQSDKLYLDEHNNIYNILNAFRHEYDGEIAWKINHNSHYKLISSIEEIPTPKNKDDFLVVSMINKPYDSELVMIFDYTEAVDGWCLTNIDILQPVEPEVQYK